MGGINTYVSSTSYTAAGGIDQQALGNGVTNDFTYDATSNRLDRIYTGKPGYLALVDLSYAYDPAATSAASTTACGRKSAATNTTSWIGSPSQGSPPGRR